MRLIAALLFAFACRASVVVDQSQIYSSGITEFHWVYEPDYGYLPLSFEGVLIDTISFGFTPWLVDDGQQGNVPPAPPQQPPCCQPGLPHVVATPEPSSLQLLYLTAVVVIGFYVIHRDITRRKR